METMKKTVMLGASAVLALSGTGGVMLSAASADEVSVESSDATAIQNVTDGVAAIQVVMLDKVAGEFSFTQQQTNSIADIKKNLGETAKYLCGSRGAGEEGQLAASAEDWQITVNGDVSNGYTASYKELTQTTEVQSVLLGCACAGNPTDGRASANAEVTGISALTIVRMAKPGADVNTVVFKSADGYEVAIPYSYLRNRYCPIVFDVNGAPIAESMGGTNQLWLGSTAASYFARDIIEITLETRDTPPANPSSEQARAQLGNLPNVGVVFGGEVS